MTKQQINFDFYKVVITSKDGVSDLDECFNSFTEDSADSHIKIKGYIRELYRLKYSKTQWSGQFRKYRIDQLPAYARFGEDEEELKLDEDQGIIERNCFIYYASRNILVWQHDAHANHADRFADFLSSITGLKIELAPLLTKTALQRLMQGDVEALKFNLSVARPTAPSLYNENTFTSNLFSLMECSGADLFNLNGGVDLRSKEAHTLNNNIVKRGLETLLKSGSAKSAKVLILEDGKRELLDLITDRIKASRSVETNKKAILFSSMIEMLESVYEEKQEVLNEVLGETQNSLL